MEAEIPPPAQEDRPSGAEANLSRGAGAIRPDWLLIGPHGLRAGWSLAIFLVLFRLFTFLAGFATVAIYPAILHFDFSPSSALVNELIPFLAMLGAAAIVSLIEHRRLVEFNLAGPRRTFHFFSGAAAGFLALTLLVAALDWGGWLHFGPVALSGAGIVKFAALWGCAFLLVGCVEEGVFRCFLLSTLTRGVNFWWALAIVSFLCADLILRSHGQVGLVAFVWMEPMGAVSAGGAWGVYAAAVLGLLACAGLQFTKADGAGFWQATWVTSTLFGFVHTSNNGENWIGIFAAAAIGFVFCVSVWVTGSAWWAIGCHAAWDWAETYFYGTADSGFVSKGHLLTARPTGTALWSGGADGPEGSLLVLAVITLLLLALLVIHARKREAGALSGSL